MRVFTIEGGDLSRLMLMVVEAETEGRYLRVAENGNGISFAVGQGMWTHPLGTDTGIPKPTETSEHTARIAALADEYQAAADTATDPAEREQMQAHADKNRAYAVANMFHECDDWHDGECSRCGPTAKS